VKPVFEHAVADLEIGRLKESENPVGGLKFRDFTV